MYNIGAYIGSGLGNQLFKIFAVISYYIDNKCNDYILYQLNDHGYREYFWNTVFKNISNKVSFNKNISEIYNEPFFHYKEIPIFNKDTILNGFFQSHKYFEHNICKIREIIGIDEQINEVLLKYPEYTVNKTISIHHRIGDNATACNGFENQLNHPIHKPKYYINSFKTLIN